MPEEREKVAPLHVVLQKATKYCRKSSNARKTPSSARDLRMARNQVDSGDGTSVTRISPTSPRNRIYSIHLAPLSH